jgi:hypothetical protein
MENKLQLEVYPDHSNATFQLNVFGNSTGNLKIRLLNRGGQIIYTEDHKGCNGSSTHMIDLSKKAKGIYLLQLTTDHELICKKLVLE